MKQIDLHNPFGGPVYHEECVSSTMDVSRALAAAGEPSGTVIIADTQESGRGRRGRTWLSEKTGLMFTLYLDFNDFKSIPEALTLRTGLAAALAIEDFIPDFSGHVKIKWPNDIMLCSSKNACKTAGVLAECDGSKIFIGMGVNLLQQIFPAELQGKAGSLLSFFLDYFHDKKFPDVFYGVMHETAWLLLEKILSRINGELNNPQWKNLLEERLFKRGERIIFADGAAESQILISGVLTGIGDAGELLIIPDNESVPRAFVNGELKVYG